MKASLGYPVGAPTPTPTPTFKDNQGIIKAIRASRIHGTIRHLATKGSWLNEQYTDGIIKLLYTKTTLHLSDCNAQPMCGKSLQAILTYLIEVRFYPLDDTKHYKSLYLDCCQLLRYDIHDGQPIPITTSS
jgi:hypothetical protein